MATEEPVTITSEEPTGRLSEDSTKSESALWTKSMREEEKLTLKRGFLHQLEAILLSLKAALFIVPLCAVSIFTFNAFLFLSMTSMQRI